MGGTSWAWPLALVLILGLLSGCVGDPGAEQNEPGSEDSQETDSGDPGMSDPEELPLVEEAREVTLYLTADRGLSPEPPSAGHIEQGDFLPDYFQGNLDVSDFLFTSDTLANASMIHAEDVLLTLFIESDHPHPPMPGFDGVGGGGFFGGEKGMPLVHFDLSDPVFLPGEPVQYDLILEFGELVPIVVPAGGSLSVLPVLIAVTADAAPARILVGADHPSSVTFSMSNLTRDPTRDLGSAQVDAFTGIIENPESPQQSYEFDLGPETEEMHVEIRHTGGHESDFDIGLFASGGRQLSRSNTPSTYESIYLMGPALDEIRGTTLTVAVTHFFAVDAEYEITVSQR